jgi:putative ABC transport system substrate-binding protein
VIARRKLLVALGLGALSAALPSFAEQQGKVWRIGFLYFGSRRSALESGRYDAFLQGMRELGYLEGKHFVVEARFAEGKDELVPSLASEIVRSKIDVIVATGTAVYAALKRSTNTIPVVITVTSDPIGDGFAASLARPGGNFTGLSTGNVELFPKQIELLRITVPKLSRLAMLWNPANPGHPARVSAMRTIAQKAGIRALPVEARSYEEIERGFSEMSREHAQAVVVLNDTFFVQQFQQIAALAMKHRLPSIYGAVEYAESGGLMGYGQNVADNFRSAATFVDKILKGAKPGELPFEQPMRLRLVINRRTAKAIGLAIPQELLLRADRVIE